MPMDQMGMGDGGMGMGGPPPAPAPAAPPASEQQGPASIFLSKDVLGGKTVKEGDSGTFTILSVDPETGDAEASIEIGGGGPMAEEGIEAAFDRQMPPAAEEGY